MNLEKGDRLENHSKAAELYIKAKDTIKGSEIYSNISQHERALETLRKGELYNEFAAYLLECVILRSYVDG